MHTENLLSYKTFSGCNYHSKLPKVMSLMSTLNIPMQFNLFEFSYKKFWTSSAFKNPCISCMLTALYKKLANLSPDTFADSPVTMGVWVCHSFVYVHGAVMCIAGTDPREMDGVASHPPSVFKASIKAASRFKVRSEDFQHFPGAMPT